jgi:hypothetical protein
MHIEDILVTLHEGQWFRWTDSKNKVYANLRLSEKMGVNGELIDNPHTLPTEKSLNDALIKAQAEYDVQDYARKREAEYPSIQDCIHAILDDDLDALQTKRAEIKKKYPKG